MTMAWIIWRSLHYVREHHEPYRAASPYWAYQKLRVPLPDGDVCTVREGFVIKERAPSTCHLIEIGLYYQDATERSSATMTAKDARRELWSWASNPKVTAIAYAYADSKIGPISWFEWPYLQLIEEESSDVLLLAANQKRYGQIRLARTEVMKRWPAPRKRIKEKKMAEQLCLQKFVEWMLASPDCPTLKRERAEKIAKSEFGLSREVARRIWAKAITQTNATAWSHPGRRPDKRADIIARP